MLYYTNYSFQRSATTSRSYSAVFGSCSSVSWSFCNISTVSRGSRNFRGSARIFEFPCRGFSKLQRSILGAIKGHKLPPAGSPSSLKAWSRNAWIRVAKNPGVYPHLFDSSGWIGATPAKLTRPGGMVFGSTRAANARNGKYRSCSFPIYDFWRL